MSTAAASRAAADGRHAPVYVPIVARRPGGGLRTTRGRVLFGLALGCIGGCYYLYWYVWLLKLYYLGWAVALGLALVALMAGIGSARGLLRDSVPVVVWFGYLLLSCTWAPAPAESLYFLSGGAVLVVAYALAFLWTRVVDAFALTFFYEFQLLLNVALMAGYLVTTGKLFDDELGAVRTGFAFSSVTALPFLIWRLRNRLSAWRVAVLGVALAASIALGSRSSLAFAPLLVAGGWLYVQPDGGSRRRAVLVLVPLVLLAVVVAAASPAVRDVALAAGSRFGDTSFDVSGTVVDEVLNPSAERVDIERRLQWYVSLQSFLGNPLRGGGYYSTYSIVGERFGWRVGAHGLPSLLFGELGLVGAACFAWLVGRAVRLLRRAAAAAPAGAERGFHQTCLLSMAGMLAFGLFHQVDQTPAFFVLIAFAYGQRRRLRDAGAV